MMASSATAKPGSKPSVSKQRLQRLQHRRRIAFALLTLLGGAALLLVDPTFDDGFSRAAFLLGGLVFIAAGVVIRVWSSLYVAGRKGSELVSAGPYSRVRNPLYVGTLSCVLGATLSFGSLTLAALVTIASFIVLDWIVRREETRLSEEFGEPYAEYSRRVNRWLPGAGAPGLTHVEARVRNVVRTTVEALLFLAAVPASALVRAAHEADWIEPLLRLP